MYWVNYKLLERVKKERGQIEHTKREALSQESKLGAKPE